MRKSICISLVLLGSVGWSVGVFAAEKPVAEKTDKTEKATEKQKEAQQEIFIAGVNPAQRPVNAPVVGETQKDQAWFSRALKGVQEPYPGSLMFLKDQGNWYTPFTQAGMLGHYDLRGWHQK